MSSLKLKAKYTRKDINNPATNTEPDTSDEGLLTLSWTPLPGLAAFVSYGIKEEKRDSLHYLYSSGTPEVEYVLELDNRKVKNERVTAVITYAFLRNLSVATSYAYMHHSAKQDIAYSDTTGFPHMDALVPYKNAAHTYSADLTYAPKQMITLNGGVTHTVSRGNFYPSSVLGQQDINQYSELRTRETVYSASGEYRFKGGFTAGIQYRHSTFNDLLDNIYDDVNDGRANIILLTISKKW